MRVATEAATDGSFCRLLVPGDEAELFAFLEPYLDSSLFFFGNVESAGLEDRGEERQGTYVARFNADGVMTAVAGHAWNNTVMVQGGTGLEEAACAAVARSARPVAGLLGPWPAVVSARRALGLEARATAHGDPESIFALDLARVQRPALLDRPDVVLRAPRTAELDVPLADWRFEYRVETLGAKNDDTVRGEARLEVQRWQARGTLWVLEVAGELVAMTGFNASARGVVQVGGVFTPKPLRSRGYARTAVAASLLQARTRGFERSVLFTSDGNLAARRAYAALGYEVVGPFGLVLFEE